MAKIKVVCRVLITKGSHMGEYIYPPPEITEDFFINYGTILKWKLDPSVSKGWLYGKVIRFYLELGELHVECEQYDSGEDITK